MVAPPLNPHEEMQEQQRLAALYQLNILDTPEEPEYDELVHLAAQVCRTPISTVTLVDAHRQWFKAAIGLKDRETPRAVSFCSQAIRQSGLFIVENAASDPHFRDYANVTGDPGIRFYAGIPLEANGYPVGTLCVIDTVPRTLTEDQRNALRILGRQVKTRIELRTKQESLKAVLAQNDKLNAELRARNNLFLAFMNNGPFVSYIKDAEGRMIFCNQRLAQRFHITQDAWTGLHDEEIWPADVATELRRNDLAVLAAGNPVEFTESIAGPDGSVTNWRSYKFPFLSEEGQPMLAGMSIDITEELRRKAELDRVLQEKLELAASLESTTQLFQTFVSRNPNICFFKSEDGTYLAYNTPFAEHFGIDETAWLGHTDHEMRPLKDADAARELDLEVLAQNEINVAVHQLVNAAGQTVWHKAFKFPIRVASGASILAGVAIDITREIAKENELAAANARLQELATTDALTGLANRRVFEQRIAADFSIARRNDLPLSVLLIDIDDFKRRNDTHGHAAGDDALRALAAVLRSIIRAGDIAGRVGGEEFAILLPATPSDGAKVFATRLQTSLQTMECTSGPLTVSIGIASLAPATGNWEQLVSEADNAMYAAKRAGKNRYMVSSLGPTPSGPVVPSP